GCRVDQFLCLTGPQGGGKSSFLRALAGSDMDIREVTYAGIGLAEIKHDLLARADSFSPYSAGPRMYVPVVTTNLPVLSDRRLRVVRIEQPVYLDPALRDQLWAEAVAGGGSI